ncbi:MAG: helix-turn-helix domain-containing protein [Chitinophagaceae bacterium]
MRFEKFQPIEQLRPYVRHFVLSEHAAENTYTVFPQTGLVIGFQYRGRLYEKKEGADMILSTAGITGLTDAAKTFTNTVNAGSLLVYFSETGFAHFTSHPVHDLFNLSLGLDELFSSSAIAIVEEKLSAASTDRQRINVVERFLLAQLRHIETDRLVMEAVRLIYHSHGTMRISDLHKMLLISQSPFEKRFRKTVGTTAKKFASIVRLNAVMKNMGAAKSLTDLCYEYGFFDQAHFIKELKQFTGHTPEQLKRFL